MSSNPYRDAFYQRQAEWHSTDSLDELKTSHDRRVPYYEWYTKNWLPEDKDAPILDIGCGAGQFVHFLKSQGYTQVTGIDLDANQVALARKLKLDCQVSQINSFLEGKESCFEMVAMLDILEHFTMSELYSILQSVTAALNPCGKVIVSVPNALSPVGLSTRYSDITHECGFSPTSLSQMFFCHHMKVSQIRDPWPAPVSFSRKIYRAITGITRTFESLRLRFLGIAPPQYWSPVIWAIAVKEQPPTIRSLSSSDTVSIAAMERTIAETSSR